MIVSLLQFLWPNLSQTQADVVDMLFSLPSVFYRYETLFGARYRWTLVEKVVSTNWFDEMNKIQDVSIWCLNVKMCIVARLSRIGRFGEVDVITFLILMSQFVHVQVHKI